MAQRRSYRHGGFNAFVRPIRGFGNDRGNAYRTETVTDLELGLKQQGRIGIPYRFNLALYQNWIDDAQRVAYTLIKGQPKAITVNVPTARVRGIEIDGAITPASWLKVGGQLDYTDAKFLDNLVSVAGGPSVEFGTYPDTARWSGAVFAEVKVPISGDIEASVRGDLYAQSSNYFSSTGNINTGAKIPGYSVVNLRVGVENDAAGWSLSGIVKNVFKKVYYVGGVALGESFQTNTAVPGDPRTFQVEARLKF